MDSLAVIILAAGLGKRMCSELPKVAIKTREKSLILHVLDTVSKLNLDRTIVVTGYKKEVVEEAIKNGSSLKNIHFAFQDKQLGTGHATKCALPKLEGFNGDVLILYGDIPLITSKTLLSFIELHKQNRSTVSLISFKETRPNQYGRIIRDQTGRFVQKIVEARDCTPDQLSICEVNSGIYLVDSAFLAPAVNDLTNKNAQAEFYLTDILERASKEGQTISALFLEQGEEVLGVNNLHDLTLINKALLMNTTQKLSQAGIIFTDINTTYIDSTVEIASGVNIGPNVQILGNTKICKGVVIEGTAYIKDCIIGEDAHIKLCVRMESATVGEKSSIGPFAHLRPGSILEADVKIGNFVETKNAHLMHGAKASHLTYLGDCSVGEESNIGAGTITANYDGIKKSKTVIGKNVSIGSNTSLVAPVIINDGAYIGAGSTITKEVESDSLTFTRSPQVSKPGWAKRRRDKL